MHQPKMAKQRAKKGMGATRNEPHGRHIRELRLYILIAALLAAAAIATTVYESSGTPIHRCNRIVLRSDRLACIEGLALSERSASLCSYIHGASDRNACIAGVALNTSSVSTCRLLNSSAGYIGCVTEIGETTLNSSACLALPRGHKSQCIYSIANATGFSNAAICSSIPNASTRSLCTYLHYYTLAVSGNRTSNCAKLPDAANESLVGALGGHATQITSYTVAAMQLNLTPRNYCYYSAAAHSGNVAACGGITVPYEAALCSAELSNFTVSYNVTANLTAANATAGFLRCLNATGSLSACASSPQAPGALSSYNATMCANIPNLTYRYSCFASLSIIYNNTNYCSYISNTTLRAGCYRNT